MGKHLLISGEYGFDDTGDEAILSATLSSLRARHPDLRFTVASGAPEQTKSLYGVEAVSWRDPAKIFEAALEADVLVVGGGGLFAEGSKVRPETLLTPLHEGVIYHSALPALARALGKRAVIVGVGVGPLESEAGRAFTRAAFAYSDRATVRDFESQAALSELAEDQGRRVEVTSDLAFALTESVASERVRALLDGAGVPRERPLAVVALRRFGRSPTWEAAVAEGLSKFLAASGAHALFVPFRRDLAGEEDDVRVARGVVASMGAGARATVLDALLGVDMTRALIAAADVVLAQRYHAALFALAAGLEPVALSHDRRVDALMRRARAHRFSLALDRVSGSDVFAALARAYGERDILRPRLLGFAEEMRALAATNLAVIEEALALPPPTPDPIMRALIEGNITRFFTLARVENELEASRARAASLEGELDGITRSATFKLARRLRDLSVRAAPKESARRVALSTGVGLVREVRRLGTRGLAKKYLPPAVQTPMLRVYHGARELRAGDRRAADRRALEAIVREHPGVRDIFVLTPSIKWDVALFQRPQQLAMALARRGALVIYVEPGRPDASHGFEKHAERLYFARVDREVFNVLDDYTLYVLSWNKAWTERLHPRRVLYDFIDDLDVFNTPDREKLERDHASLLRDATVVSATADLLWREVKEARPDAILCPNGVDYAHFEQARDPALAPPGDIADIIASKRPIIGYYGALARWFDYDLLWAVASRRPDLFFLLIGPDYDKTLAHKSLFDLANVRWIGPRHYSILPRYLRAFDVATVPFKVNAITHATSPLKLFEYMAGGKVVVTTPMLESMRYENVLIGKDPESFSKKLSEALMLRDDPAHRALNDRIARENTWDSRAEMLLKALGR